MLINQKEIYLKFMILVKLRYNVEICKCRIKDNEEILKKDPDNFHYNCRYNDTLNFYNENIRIAKELFNIEINDNLEQINEEICKNWPNILEYLKTNNCDYGWTIKDFEDTKYYETYKYITSYDLYWETKSTKSDTDPIYFEFEYLKFADTRFINIFEDIVNNGLFDPNKRAMNYSHEPFWALNFPDDYNPSDISNRIIFDKRCNYRMLDNGTDNVLLLLQRLTGFFGKDNLTTSQKKFALNFLYKIIKENNCSILQEYIDDTSRKCGYNLDDPLIFILFNNENKLTEYDEINNLYKYCISYDGVINQCDALEHKTEGCNKAIDFYISLIEKDNPENNNGVQLLKRLKYRQ